MIQIYFSKIVFSHHKKKKILTRIFDVNQKVYVFAKKRKTLKQIAFELWTNYSDVLFTIHLETEVNNNAT